MNGGELVSWLDTLLERYEGDRALRVLVKLFSALTHGVGAIAEVAMEKRMEHIREEQARAFFEELAATQVEISPDLVDSDGFIFRFTRIAQVVQRTQQKEKIRMAARLFAATSGLPPDDDGDDFERHVTILEALSAKELTLMRLLARAYDQYHKSLATSSSRTNVSERRLGEAVEAERAKMWAGFIAVVRTTLRLEPDEVDDLLAHIGSVGCVRVIQAPSDEYATATIAMPTVTYWRLKAFIDYEVAISREMDTEVEQEGQST